MDKTLEAGVTTARDPMRTLGLVALIAAVFFSAVSARAQTSVSTQEQACARRLSKTAVRLARVWARATIECRIDLARGGTSGPCPGAKGEAAVAPLIARMFSRTALFCEGQCSVSDGVRCVSDDLCPPLPSAGAAESCVAGADRRPFDMNRIGFPGPFCEQALGHPLRSSTDIAQCVHVLSLSASSTLADMAFGEVAPAVLSDSGLACQRTLARRMRRLASVVHATITNCRNAILRGVVNQSPADCLRADRAYLERSALNETKLDFAVRQACSDEDVAELDICGAGVGGITTVDEAIDCATAAAYEIAASPVAPAFRDYTQSTLIEAAFPPVPSCGDGQVNQTADAFLPLGEECDGADDDACPGACIPPGDLFECTCGDRPRMRFLADSAATNLDHGWTGTAMNVTLPEGSGFTMDLSACDCDEMDGAACIGASTDPVCAVSGALRPHCQWDPPGAPRCDARGNGNLLDEDADCWVCDANSSNAGAPCRNERDCEPLCYDADGGAIRPCPAGQGDCASGEVCRGRCDRAQRCIVLGAAPPAPVSSRGSPICIVQSFRDDLVGTTNVMTGEHELYQRTRVQVYFGGSGITPGVPCPVCGGFCEGGPFDGEVCRGTCRTSGDSCRFDTDCPAEDTCTTRSAQCPEGSCNLALVCHAGANDGAPCRIESETEMFGGVSSDCPPANGSNVTGSGLLVDYLPATSEAVELPSILPCTAPGYELFDCPCPDDGGARTKPNECAPACDAGPEAGQGCADGNNAFGFFTTCKGGAREGRACDESSDCPGGDCSRNPYHCTGDPEFIRVECSTNSDCGVGSCVDACPTGRCVPLCVSQLGEPEQGVCAAGPPLYHCSGELETFRTCDRASAASDCGATCDTSHTPCAAQQDCPPGETCAGPCEKARACEAGNDGVIGTADDIDGAGLCIEDARVCPLDSIQAEGGDIFNGKGGPTTPLSAAAFCLGKTANPGLNAIVGVGGPGRLRRAGTYITNGFFELP
jgi:hypothetical protein